MLMYAYLLIGCLVSFGNGQIVRDNSSKSDLNNTDVDGQSEAVRWPTVDFIYPGTKWCGSGDIASNDSDLGILRETDACCRAHDKCPDVIYGHESKYNLTNNSQFTRMNCNCTYQFYSCLKIVGSSSISAISVGQLYFNLLGTKCFRNDYPIIGCKNQILLPRRKCLKYELDTDKPMEYQWFDLPRF